MNQLDRIFRLQVAEQVQDSPRARAAIPNEFVAAAAGAGLKYTGYTKPIASAVPYPLSLHNPFTVETLVQRNLRLLDTCLVLRTQYFDYQKLSQDSEASYKLFLDSIQIERNQEAYLASDEGTGSSVIVAQKETEQTAAGQTRGSADSIRWAKIRDEKLRSFAEEKRKRLSDYEAAQAARRADVNEGSNFAARQRRIETRYVELLLDATYRSWAISDGFRMLYDKSFDPPQPSDEFLDELVAWHKMVVDEMEKVLRRDTEYPLTLNLRYAQKDGRNLPVAGPAPLATTDPLATGWAVDRTKLAEETIRFRLDPAKFFPDQDHLRLRGVALSVGPEKPGLEEKRGTWRVMVKPPLMAITDGATVNTLGIPPLYLGEVKDRLAGEPRATIGGYFNVDPCAGEWELRILGNSSIGEPFTKIVEVEVILIVATLPKPR